MPNVDAANGLNSVDKITEAADALTGVAEMVQRRVKQQFERKKIQQAQAHELFASINQIRHIANTLYTTAAAAVVKNLGETQKAVLDVINGAKGSISKIDETKKLIDLVADLIALAAAINTGKAGPILACLKEVNKDTKKLSEDNS
jgi:hypothetical protein